TRPAIRRRGVRRRTGKTFRAEMAAGSSAENRQECENLSFGCPEMRNQKEATQAVPCFPRLSLVSPFFPRLSLVSLVSPLFPPAVPCFPCFPWKAMGASSLGSVVYDGYE